MIDDHNRCEWVNVSSGTSSLGLSWMKSRERKMVVVIVVAVLDLRTNNILDEFSALTLPVGRQEEHPACKN